MKRYLSVWAFWTLLSCNIEEKKSQNPLSEFKDIQNKKAELVNIGDKINRAFELAIFDGLLIVSDPDQDFHFKVFDLENEELVDKFGLVGDGPCELKFPASLQNAVGDDSRIGVNDRNRFAFIEIPYGRGNEYFSETCIKIGDKFDFNYQKILKIGENHILGIGLFDSRYAISEISSKKVVEKFGNYPHESELKNHSHNVLAMAYQGDIQINPSQPWVVTTTRNSFNFDIIKFDENAQQIGLKEFHYWYPEFDGEENSGFIQAKTKTSNRKGCLSVSVSNDFIYILYSGKSKKNGGDFGNQVLVYDWEGKPRQIISLDRDVELIAVDRNDKFLIGYLDDGKANIFRVSL